MEFMYITFLIYFIKAWVSKKFYSPLNLKKDILSNNTSLIHIIRYTPQHLGHSEDRYTATGRGFDSFYGLYLGGGDHFLHTLGNPAEINGIWQPQSWEQ